jgi:transcriptional regulator with XRE-family HTH domain
LTLRELAEKSGVGKDTISRLENYQGTPQAQTLRKLVDALEVPIAELSEDLTRGRERIMEEAKTKDKVEVRVTWEDSQGRLLEEILRFRGEEIYRIDGGPRGNTVKTLYKCPDGFRVEVNNQEEEMISLYPNHPNPSTGETEYPTYSPEELVEEWPEFRDEDLVGAVRVRDLD